MIEGGFPERRWMRRPARGLVAIGLFLALATVTKLGPLPAPAGPGTTVMTVRPVPLDPADPALHTVGRLRFLGGWALASPDRRFGGISAIHVDGHSVTALNDVGVVIRFALPQAGRSLPVRFLPIEAGPGPRTPKENRDTEGLLIRGDEAWVSFEHHNMVWRYRLSDWSPLSSARPPAMRLWPGNSGAEGLVRLADGRFIVFGEGRDDGRTVGDAVLFDGDPSLPLTPEHLIHYRRVAGFRASDAATLPDGRILLLTRRFRLLQGWEARLAIVDPAGINSGSTIESREVASFQAPLTVDNLEGLSVTVEGGSTIVWIASDDNFGTFQRTLLLKFELDE